MKQLIILSGKGGTGKTTVSGAFIELNKLKAFADCDVDAPNLHMIAGVKEPDKTTEYYGLNKAVIDADKCVHCGLCEDYCRFKAIKNCKIDIYECEGCGVCTRICPVQAISMEESATGNILLYKQNNFVFSTAKLNMGSGASGKLVTEVKKQLTKEANEEIAVIDGSPGIGCPVIATISGAYMVLIVAEPTVSGIHDLKRIIGTSKNFGVKCAVCINKYDVNIGKTEEIEQYCKSIDVETIGRIPYDKTVITALEQGKNIMIYPDSPSAKAITLIWETIYKNYLI